MPPTKAASTETTLYVRLGGEAGIKKIIHDSIILISQDKRIQQRFANANGPNLQQNLYELVCERTGGPCVYRGQNMADAHERMFVRDEEFDALVEDMGKAMDMAGVRKEDKVESLAMLAKLRNAIVGH